MVGWIGQIYLDARSVLRWASRRSVGASIQPLMVQVELQEDFHEDFLSAADYGYKYRSVAGSQRRGARRVVNRHGGTGARHGNNDNHDHETTAVMWVIFCVRMNGWWSKLEWKSWPNYAVTSRARLKCGQSVHAICFRTRHSTGKQDVRLQPHGPPRAVTHACATEASYLTHSVQGHHTPLHKSQPHLN